MYLSYVGLRVTNLTRSFEFYTELFGLRPRHGKRPPADTAEPASILLFDPRSSQRLELNYYPPGSPYSVPYVPGEGCDHLAFRVDDLPRFLAELSNRGLVPERMAHYDGPMQVTAEYRVAYLRDPDGNQIELFDTPGSPTEFRPEEY